MKGNVSILLLFIAVSCLPAEWESVDFGPNLPGVNCIVPDPAHARVFIGNNKGYRFLHIPSDEYEIREFPSEITNWVVASMETDPNDPMFLVTGRWTAEWVGYIMDNYGLITNGPWVWDGYDHGNPGVVFAIEKDPTDPDRLFACTEASIGSGRILRSTSNGESWEEVFVPCEYSCQDLVIGMTGVIYVAYGDQLQPPGSVYGVLCSSDNGDTWQDATGDMNPDYLIKHLVIDPLVPGHIYAGQGGYWEPDDVSLGLYESTDGGGHWVKILDGNIQQLSIHPDSPEILVAVIDVSEDIYGASIQLTRDGGETWEDITGSLPWFGGNEVCAISAADQRIYVGDYYDGFFRTDLFPTHVEPVVPALRDLQIHPSPFNPNATISFTVDSPVHARVAVYNSTGREIIVLAEKEFSSGTHQLQWRGQDSNGRDVASGVYLINVSSQHCTETTKAILLR